MKTIKFFKELLPGDLLVCSTPETTWDGIVVSVATKAQQQIQFLYPTGIMKVPTKTRYHGDSRIWQHLNVFRDGEYIFRGMTFYIASDYEKSA
jgi:hypothetical protein